MIFSCPEWLSASIYSIHDGILSAPGHLILDCLDFGFWLRIEDFFIVLRSPLRLFLCPPPPLFLSISGWHRYCFLNFKTNIPIVNMTTNYMFTICITYTSYPVQGSPLFHNELCIHSPVGAVVSATAHCTIFHSSPCCVPLVTYWCHSFISRKRAHVCNSQRMIGKLRMKDPVGAGKCVSNRDRQNW